MNFGKVYLVGAGPGDPDLITVKGLRLLRQADVILYDRLAPAELLREARSDAELIDASKMPKNHTLEQNEINALLIEKAKAGLMVVRLKGGDPMVFGRGGEEALACQAEGISFEIVPGVSSAIAVPAYAGVPVTYRDLSMSFTVFTGHEPPDSPTNSLDYNALARMETLVILMGMTYFRRILEALLAEGLDPQTPALCIEWGATGKQRVVEGKVGELYRLAEKAGVKSPAITVIGKVAALRAQGLRWFD